MTCLWRLQLFSIYLYSGTCKCHLIRWLCLTAYKIMYLYNITCLLKPPVIFRVTHHNMTAIRDELFSSIRKYTKQYFISWGKWQLFFLIILSKVIRIQKTNIGRIWILYTNASFFSDASRQNQQFQHEHSCNNLYKNAIWH